MTFLKSLFCAMSALLLLIAPSLAQDSGKAASSKTFSVDGHVYQDTLLSKFVNYDAQIGLYSLMGDPVVSTRLRYSFAPGSTAPLPALDGSGTYFDTDVNKLPAEARNLFQAHNVRIAFRFKTGLTTPSQVQVISDVGDPGKPDGETWSFNVPESPDWGELFLRDSPGSSGYISAEDAKRVLQSDLELWDVQIVSIDYTAYDLHGWYRNTTRWPEVRAAVDAYNYLADAVERSTGFKAGLKAQKRPDSQYHSVAYDAISQQQSELDALHKAINKLMNLPQDFLSGVNPRPYETARAEAPSFEDRARQQQATWHSPDIDPATLPKGYQPKGIKPEIRIRDEPDEHNQRRQFVYIDGKRAGYNGFGTFSKTIVVFSKFLLVNSDTSFFAEAFQNSQNTKIEIYDAYTGSKISQISGLLVDQNSFSRIDETPGNHTHVYTPDRLRLLHIERGGHESFDGDYHIGKCHWWRSILSGTESVYDSNMQLLSTHHARYADYASPPYETENYKYDCEIPPMEKLSD